MAVRLYVYAMSLTKEDTFYTFPNDIGKADILGLIRHYDKKGVTKYCFTYRGQKIVDIKLTFVPNKDTVEIELR